MPKKANVFALGYPIPEEQLALSPGTFRRKETLLKSDASPTSPTENLSRPVLNFFGSTDKGNSGGGLFTEDGLLVGLVGRGGQTSDGTHYGIAYPASDVSSLISKVSKATQEP